MQLLAVPPQGRDYDRCTTCGALQVTRGTDNLAMYQWNTKIAKHYFCKTCGIYTHYARRNNSNEYGINIACLDGAPCPLRLGRDSGWSTVTRCAWCRRMIQPEAKHGCGERASLQIQTLGQGALDGRQANLAL